jgi:hypothetical protein
MPVFLELFRNPSCVNFLEIEIYSNPCIVKNQYAVCALFSSVVDVDIAFIILRHCRSFARCRVRESIRIISLLQNAATSVCRCAGVNFPITDSFRYTHTHTHTHTLQILTSSRLSSSVHVVQISGASLGQTTEERYSEAVDTPALSSGANRGKQFLGT